MKDGDYGAKAFGLLLIIFLFGGAALVLALQIGIWLPDVLYAARHTLAAQELPSGHKFRVVQYWNRVDFYNTELIHIFPNGKSEISVLDGDDNKTWRVPLTVDESNRIVRVTLGGRREKTVSW